MKTANLDIRNVPDEILQAAVEDARARNVTVNAAVVAILADRYAVRYDSPPYPFVGVGGSNHWNLRMPAVLADAIRAHAKATGATITGIVLRALAAEYGLPMMPTTPRKPPRLSADQIEEIRRRNSDGESIRSLATTFGVTRKTLTRALRV